MPDIEARFQQAALMGQFLNHGGDDLVAKAFAGSPPDSNLRFTCDYTINSFAGNAVTFSDHGLYYDTEQAFVLTYDHQPVAYTGIGFWENAVQVRQLQGVRGAKRLYGLGRWEHALVRVVEGFAHFIEKGEVHIEPADQNCWVKDYLIRSRGSNGPVRGLSPEKAKLRYDGTALHLGYEYDEDRLVYVKRWPYSSSLC